MKRMLTTEQIKKVENNCGTIKQTEPLFVPFTKKTEYYQTPKRLEVEVNIDFTDCLPGYTYTLDWWNPETNESDRYLNYNWPSDTWAEAVNQWRDIEIVQLKVYIYGLKSGIDFVMPLSLFVIEENILRINNIYARTKDEDKYCIAPIMYKYDEQNDVSSWSICATGGSLNPFTGGSFTERSHSLTFYLRTNGPMVYVGGGY